MPERDYYAEEAARASLYGLETRHGNGRKFTADIETEMTDGTPVAMLETIGATWFIFESAGLAGYIVANQGAGSYTMLTELNPRGLRWYATPAAWSKLQAWNQALAFITAEVRSDLEAEWGSDHGPVD